MHKILTLKQVLNNFYINDTKVNHEQFNNIFNSAIIIPSNICR